MGWYTSTAKGKQVLHVFLPLKTAQHRDAGAGGSDSRGANPSTGSVLGKGDSVSFALHLPHAVLSLCCADPTGAPVVRGSWGSWAPQARQLPAPARRRLWLPVSTRVFSFPCSFPCKRGWTEGANCSPLFVAPMDRSPSGSTATAGWRLRDLLLPRERSAGAGQAMSRGPATLLMALPCSWMVWGGWSSPELLSCAGADPQPRGRG